MPIYDSANKTRISFPGRATEHSFSAFSASTEQLQKANRKEASAEYLIVKQVERDLHKLKEDMLQTAIERD